MVSDKARAATLLRDVFGFDGFRPGQEQIVEAVTQGEYPCEGQSLVLWKVLCGFDPGALTGVYGCFIPWLFLRLSSPNGFSLLLFSFRGCFYGCLSMRERVSE